MENVFRSNSYSNIQKRQYDDASQMAYEGRGITSLKLEAQKIRDFTGLTMDWTKWKNQTECAFDGDLIKNKNAEIVRVKLDGPKLYPGISASDYINNFMNLSNELNKIEGEAYSDNHYKFLFLKNIEHPDYQVTKKLFKV